MRRSAMSKYCEIGKAYSGAYRTVGNIDMDDLITPGMLADQTL